MSDVGFALEAKSDQLNAMDIIGAEPVIRIRDAKVQKSEQPVWIYFDGDNNRPWKPSKGMLRILAGAWGKDTAGWVGKMVKLYFEPSVMYAGKEIGGIRIRAMSDIDERGLSFAITINRQKREPYHVPLLKIEAREYPADRFQQALPKMAEAMKKGDMTLQQVIAQCQKTGSLSTDQLAQLEAVAPVEVPHENDDEDEVF